MNPISLQTHPAIFWLLTLLLLAAAYLVFRVIVRADYRLRGRLTWASSTLQLLVFAGVMGYPYLFNPPEWIWFWMLDKMPVPTTGILGLVVILLGFGVAFGTMAWFGMRRAFGLATEGLVARGPYRFSRNPQILGGYLLVTGVALQWPSWYALLWIALYGVIGHWMILTEEEHLRKIGGEAYARYCEKTPRYLFRWPRP